jgi:hypothetical protein
MHFEPENPFPLIDPSAYSYSQAQAHAAEADRWLGLEVEQTEARLAHENAVSRPGSGVQAWIGLEPQALLTPYIELRLMIERLDPRPEDWLVDLGCAYGRLAFVLARHYPRTHFRGYELIGARVQQAQRALGRFAPPEFDGRVEARDITRTEFHELELPREASTFFIYDFGTREAISGLLGQLRLRARTNPLRIIGRGRATRDAIERGEPWLSQVHEPRHFGNFSIYRS